MHNKGLMIGMSGLFAGAIAAASVGWGPLPKATLVVGVAIVVSLAVHFLVRNR